MRLRFFLPALAALLLLLAAPAHAQSVLYVDGGANGAGDGSSWTDAYTNVQTAIDNAAATDEIWIAEGTYKPTGDPLNRDASFTIPASKDGLKLYGGFEGEATETRLADRDPDAHEVVLSGDIDAGAGHPDRAFAPTEDSDGIPETATATDHIDFRDIVSVTASPATFSDGANSKNVVRLGSGITAATVIDGVTITGGFATVPDIQAVDDNLGNILGGGLFCDGCSATFRGVTFKGNYARKRGGGVYVSGGGSPTFVNTTFWGNSAGGSAPSAAPNRGTGSFGGWHRDPSESGEDGGLFVGSGSATLTNVTFLENSVYDNGEQNGAGDVLSGSGVTVQNSILTSGCPGGATCQNTVSSDLDLSGPRPGPQSSAIGAGDPSFLPEDSEDLDGDGNTTEPLPLDAGGDARVQLGFPDVGAFETDRQFFSPATDAVAPGETLVITGQRLDQVTAVAVNGTSAPDFTSVSAQRLEATVPQDATTGPVTLTIDGTDLDTDAPVQVIDAYGPGRALGNNATVELPDESAFDFTSSFTVSAWMKATGSSGIPAYIEKPEGDAFSKPFSLDSRGKFTMNGSLFQATFSEGDPSDDGDWRHVTGVYDADANEVRVYVDGVQGDVANDVTSDPDLSNAPVTIGTGGGETSGNVDNVRFYTRALSDGEIQDLARRHRRLALSESKADDLLASYRFDTGSGTAYDYAGRRSGTYTSGGPTAFSTAPIGIEQGTTVGPAGAQLASNVGAYRYGRLGGPARTDGDPGESFSTEILTQPTERANLTWGLIEDAGSTTIDYSNVGLSAPVGLLYRTGPGDDWEVADGWTKDADSKTFTANSAPAGEYAVASFPTADLALTLTADQEDVPEGQPASFTATVTNNGPDAVPSGVTVSFTPTGLGSLSATGGPFSDDTWTLDALNSGASATLTLEGTAATGTDVRLLRGSIDASDTDAANNSAGAALSYGSGRSLALNGSAKSEHVSTGRTSSELGLDASQPVTVEAWIRWDGAAHETVVSDGIIPIVGLDTFDEDSPITLSQYIGLRENGVLQAAAGSRGNTQLTPNRWYHVAYVYSGGQWTYYVNGTPDGTSSEGLPGGREVWIGKSTDSRNVDGGATKNTHYFGGQIDQLRIWSAALTQREIRARMRQTIGEGDPGREDLTLSYRFDGSGSTVTSNAGVAQGTLQGGAGRSPFSSAPLGQQSALATSSSDASVGPSGSALSASDVSGDPVQLYRYGAEDAAVRDGSDAADDFSALPDFISERSDLVWGVDAPKDASPSATLTLDYSHVGSTGPLAAPVNLLHRERPGDPWEVAPGWTKDPAAQTFTHTGAAPTGQYALAEFQNADLAVSLAPTSQDVRIDSDAAFTVTVTNTGPDAAPAGTAVALTAGTGLADPIAENAPANGTYDAASGTWTLGTLASGASATLEVTGTYDGAADPAPFDAALTPPSDAVDLNTGNHAATAEVALDVRRFHVDAATGNDSNDGTSWGQAFATLTKALDAAQAQDTIWVAEGVYRPDEGPGVTDGDPSAAFTLTGAQDGVALYGGFEPGDAFADRDPDAHPVVLSGDIDENDATNANGVTETAGDITGTNSTRVLHLDGTTGGALTRATILDGVTVTGGQADGASTESGGGLLCDGAGSGNECSPTLARVWFAGNESDHGGALALDGSGGGASSPSLINAVFTGNAAQSGGALYVTGADGGTADPVLANAALTNNTATDGGALFVNANAGGTSRLSLVQATIQSNSATNRGGAVYVTGTGSPSTAEPTLTGVILWGNSADSGGDQMAVTGAGARPTVSHTLLAGGLGAVVTFDSAFVNDGGNNLDADPQFVNAADPDGVDDTFGTTDDGLRVTPGSPALDAGDGTALPADALDLDGDDDTAEPLPVDLTGAERVQDGTVDVGAYEGGTPALAIDAFAPTAAAPGETVTITGTRLTNTSEVTIGGTDASFTAESSTEVTVTVPDGAATGPLQLTANGQTVSGPSDLGVVPAPYGPAGALDFDGTDDWIQANAVSDALSGASGMTMETWVRLDDTGSGQTGLVVFNTSAGGNRNWLGYNHSPGKFLYFDEEVGADQFAQNPSPTGTWHHVAATLDAAGNGILYVNGRKEATFTTSVRPATGGVFSLGQDLDSGGPTDFVDGQMDQARLWSTALTPEQLHARMHRTVGPSDPLADELVAAYRFDAGTGTTAFDYAGPQAGTFQGDPQWTAVSAARLGQESAVATNGSDASVGPTDATLTAANVASGDTVQVYRFGAADAPLRSGSDPGEDLGSVFPDERSDLTWGIATPTDPPSGADLTLQYGAVQNLSGPIALLRRDAPGAPWSEATGWTHDTDNQQFTHTGTVPAGQYAVAVLPVADLGVQVSPQVQSVLDGETASFSLTVTNNGPDDASAATVTLTPGNGLSGFTAASGPSTGTFDPDAHTWTIGALASGQSATLTLESTYDGAFDPTTLQAAVADSTVDDRQGNNDDFPAQVRRQAARLYVNAATGDDSNSGRSWGQAFATLSQALDTAFDGDEIWIAQGTYYPDEGPGVTDGDRTAVFTITGAQDGLKIYGGFAGGESSRDARDPEANPVVLSGDIGQDDAPFAPTEDTDNDPNTPAQTDHVNGDNSYTVVHLDGTTGGTLTTATVLDGVTITGGQSVVPDGSPDESTLTTNGGGLFCDGGGTGDVCSPTLTRIQFRGNEASVTGGGMSARADDGGTTSPVLTRVTFTGNVSDVTAGGLYASTAGGTTKAAIARSHFEHNAADFDGGGFSAFARSSGTSAPTVVNTTFANNTADDEGGAIELKARANSTTSAEIANVLFLDNSAENGGAVASVTSASSGTNSTTLTNATFVGNTATQNGGALYNVAPFDGTVEPTLTNALVWDNTAGAGGPQIYNEASTVTLTVANTLLEGGLAGIVDSDGASTTDGGGNLSSAPQFVNAADPNGVDDAFATADDGLRVVPGSPAVNAGDGTALPADALDLDDDDNTSEPLPVDLTGAERVQDGTVDLGAYEGGTPALALDGFAPTAAAPGETVTLTGTRLTNTSSVTLSGASVPFTVESSTEVTVTLPDDAATGPLQLTMNGQTVSGATDLGVLDPPYGPGTALAFDGAQDGSGAYVEAPTDALDTTAPFTVEAWIKWDGSDGFRMFFSKPDASQSSGFGFVVFDGDLRAGLDPVGDGPTRQVTLPSIPANEWIHVATTYDGTAQALYVNGEQVDAATYDSELFTVDSSEPVLIGREFLPGFLDDRTFPGQIDQVRTWSGTLTEAQIHARMHRTIEPGTPAASNLVASFRFDAGSGSTAFDHVGSHAGTLHNNAQWTTFSGARVGPESAVAVNGSSASVGPSGAALTAANVASGDTVQVYRFGTPDGSVRTGSDPGEAFDPFPVERPPVTWGIATPTDPASGADLTLDYSSVQNLSAGPVELRRRDGPGAPWSEAAGWTHDTDNQQFTRSGAVPVGQYAVVARPPIHVDAATGSDANRGTSWDQAVATLTKALDVATGADEIWIAEGTYHPDEGPGVTQGDRTASFTITGAQDGLAIYGGFAGDESSVTERDPAAHPVVLSGDIGTPDDASDNSYTVVLLDGTTGGPITTDTEIRGVTVADGNANGFDERPTSQGGGLFCDGAGAGNECSPTLAGMLFRGNEAADAITPPTYSLSGGAIVNDGRDGGTSSPHITSSVFVDNVAGINGGAMFNNGEGGASSPRITNCLFLNNTAGRDGGAIYSNGSSGASSPSILSSSFVNNNARDGGALFNSGSTTDTPSLSNVILYGNTASRVGEQIANQGVTLTVSHTLLEGGLQGISEDGSSTVDDGGTLDAAPQFVNPNDPAGPDGTVGTADDGLLLRPGSPAVDAGTNSAIPSGVTTDLLGTDRTQDGDGDGTATVSLGAYETVGNPAATSLPISGTDGEGNDRGWRLLGAPYGSTTAGALRLTHAAGTTAPRLGIGVVALWDDSAPPGQEGDPTGGYVTADAASALDAGRGFLLFLLDDNTAPVDAETGLTVSVEDDGATLQPPEPVSVDLTNTARWHLVANPHPTSYRLNALTVGGQPLPAAGFQADVQIYDAPAQTWRLKDASAAVRVAPWQGFFIERSTPGNGPTTVTFEPRGRTQGAPFIGTKQNAAGPVAEVQRGQIDLRVTATSSAADTTVLARDDAAALRFHEQATPGFDPFDASKMAPLAETFVTLAPVGPSRGDSLAAKAIESRPWWPPDSIGAAEPVDVPLRLRYDGLSEGAQVIVSARRWTVPDGWTARLTDTRGTAEADDDTSVPFDPTTTYETSLAPAASDTARFVLQVAPNDAALPVEWAGFEGTVDEESIRLSWQTATEQNNAGFYVQRRVAAETSRREVSTGGGEAEEATWTRIGFVEGAGTTEAPQSYRFADSDLPYTAARPTYRLRQVDTDGTASFSDPITVERDAPTEVKLLGSFPNPARTQATLRYALPRATDVRLTVYDVLGRRVQTLVDGRREAGRKQLRLDASRLSSGIYFYRLTVGETTRTRKLTVVR